MSYYNDDYRIAKQMLYFLFRLAEAILIAAILTALLFVAREAFSAEPTPLPISTPAPEPSSPEGWLKWLETQPTVESFWISYVERGLEVREWERCVQVPGAGCGVISTMGYILDDSGKGLWAQGFVENEVYEPASWIGRMYEGIAYAAQGKSKVKSSHKFQKKLEKKPAKPKKIKWRDEYSIAY